MISKVSNPSSPLSLPPSLLQKRFTTMKGLATPQTHGNYIPLHAQSSSTYASHNLSADNFALFFTEKVATISIQFDDLHRKRGILTRHWKLSYHLPTGPSSTLLQAITPMVCPAVTSVIHASFASGTFQSTFKQARMMPLLKKPSLNPTQIENNWLVSVLPFLSKAIGFLNKWLSFSLKITFWTQTSLVSKVATPRKQLYYLWQKLEG